MTAEKMNGLGIFTGLDLRGQNEAFLTRYFGKAGRCYYGIARAIDERPVTPNRVRKSVGSENTFEQDLLEHSALAEALNPLIDSVWSYCERTGVRGKTVTLKVKYADFSQITRSRSLASGPPDKSVLTRIAIELLDSVMPLTYGVRLLGVSLSNLQEKEHPAGGQIRLDLQ